MDLFELEVLVSFVRFCWVFFVFKGCFFFEVFLGFVFFFVFL